MIQKLTYDKEKIELFKKKFPEFKNDSRLDNADWFNYMSEIETAVRAQSFEEKYWNGFIILADVPHLVYGWFQSELAAQYHSEPPEYPEFVSIEKVKR